MPIINILTNEKLMASEFSKWLKDYRRESGLTLIQLRDAIGNLCTDAYLSRLENDRFAGKKGKPAQPSLEIVDALAKALNRPTDEARLAAGYAPLSKTLPLPEPVAKAFARSGHLNENDMELIANFVDMLESQRKNENL